MKIIINNIGAFKYAEFSLADLTIICGKNNTGKSYITYALFGFLDYFKNVYRVKISKEEVEGLLGKGSLKIKLDCSLAGLTKYLDDACKDYVRYLPRVFGSQENNFSHSSFRIVLEESDVNVLNVLKKLKSAKRTYKDTLIEIGKSTGKNDIEVTVNKDSFEYEITSSIIDTIESTLGDIIKDILFGDIFPECFIFCAQREGIVLFYNDLHNDMCHSFKELSFQTDGLYKDSFSQNSNVTYSVPVLRNIAFLENLGSLARDPSELMETHPDLKSKLTKLTGGEYRLTERGFTYVPSNSKTIELNMVESGSSVRSLSLISSYLSHVARSGQLLIMEEPELYLHPENQRRFARLIASLVNSGIRILLTTHSDYILKEFNTLIMLKSRLEQDHISIVMDRYGYSEDELLDIDMIKVFVSCKSALKLENNLRKTKLQTLVEAPKNHIFGIFTDNFDETVDQMNQIQNHIIFGGKE